MAYGKPAVFSEPHEVLPTVCRPYEVFHQKILPAAQNERHIRHLPEGSPFLDHRAKFLLIGFRPPGIGFTLIEETSFDFPSSDGIEHS